MVPVGAVRSYNILYTYLQLWLRQQHLLTEAFISCEHLQQTVPGSQDYDLVNSWT